MERKIEKKYVEERLGFPVTLTNVPMRLINGEWQLDLPFDALEMVIVWMLAHLPVAFTSKHLLFVRRWMGQTQEEFADYFGLSNAAVSKWERKGDEPTGMSRATEVYLRFIMVLQLPDELWETLAASTRNENQRETVERWVHGMQNFQTTMPHDVGLAIPIDELERAGLLPREWMKN